MGCCSKINYGDWSGWSKCTAPCGGGTQSRSRSKTSAYDGSSCGTESQSQECNTQSCCSESNPSGCPKMYVCKGSTYFHEYPQYSTGSQTLLPWAKVSVLGKSGEFTKVYVDPSQPHAGKWNRYSVGYIKTECLVTWANWNEYYNSGSYDSWEDGGNNCYQFMVHNRNCSG